MSDALVIILTGGLVATALGLLGPFLVLRRVALMGDAVSHAVLPGIVAVFLVAHTRAPFAVIAGAAIFAVVCVLAIEALRNTGRVRSDAAIGLVFPALFALGVLGIHRYAANIHLDLDSTIYGEIAFTPFRTVSILGVEVAQSLLVGAVVVAVNLILVVVAWKELKATSFDTEFSRTIGLSPKLLARVLLVATAVTAVTAFESVGAILVVALLIVPAAAAYLLTDRLWVMVALAVAIGWVAAVAGRVCRSGPPRRLDRRGDGAGGGHLLRAGVGRLAPLRPGGAGSRPGAGPPAREAATAGGRAVRRGGRRRSRPMRRQPA